MIVQDLMTEFPEALKPEDTIQKAAKLMRDHDYGIVPTARKHKSASACRSSRTPSRVTCRLAKPCT